MACPWDRAKKTWATFDKTSPPHWSRRKYSDGASEVRGARMLRHSPNSTIRRRRRSDRSASDNDPSVGDRWKTFQIGNSFSSSAWWSGVF